MNRMYGTVMAVLFAAGLSACAATPTQRATGEFVDDAGITARVKTALLKDDNVKGSAINVNTYRGVVQLSGFVDSEAMARRAALAASRVAGVQSIENNIRVAPRR
jgi:hyperosmotically inducible protein